MINETVARRASKSKKLSLQSFPEFVGTGVVHDPQNSSHVMVAVYVSEDPAGLSDSFKRAVPTEISVVKLGKTFSVETKIVDIGKISVG